MMLAHVAGVIGNGDLENRFREINGYSRMRHSGLLLSEREGTWRLGAIMTPNTPPEESILSHAADGRCRLAACGARGAPSR
jgi:hypothetical protein